MIKNIAKHLIYRLASQSEKGILQAVHGKSVVSFDVFDTAVKRDIPLPLDVFKLMEHKLQDDPEMESTGFAALRVSAEKEARTKNPGREVTLAEIYDQMPFGDVQKRRLMALECEMEVDISAPNIPMKRIYDACVQQGKKILFISDMFLPAEVIEKILRKSGYEPAHLYVSCEAGARKRDGRLFSYVQQKENLSFDAWSHIGDSISADYLSPKRLGIQAILIENIPHHNRYVHKGLYRKNACYRRLNHFIDTRLCRYTDPYERIGYAVLGPLLYGFACRLEKEIPQDASIVFLAREGALLKRAFEMVSKRSAVYMHVSRDAANLAYLDNVTEPETVFQDEALFIKQYSTLKELVKSFGLSGNDARNVFTAHGFTEDTVVRSRDAQQQVIAPIWKTIKDNACGQHDMLQQYLEQLGVTNRCTVVDVGWYGSIQSLLSAGRYMKADQTIQWSGYYLGCFRDNATAGYNRIEKKGFLFDGESDRYLYEGIRNSAPFFELLFLSTEGTTERYGRDGCGKVYPVLGQPENGGKIGDKIISMQNAGIQFVRDLHQSEANILIDMDAKVSAYNYQSLARVPSLSTLSLFDDFKSYSEGSLNGFGSEHSLGYYVIHPKAFLNEFKKKSGRTWFLKDVFKIPLPYVFMVNLARKLS